MKHELSTFESIDDPRAQGDAPRAVEALVVIWCGEEPERVGEVLLLPPAGDRRSFVFGRGEGDEGRHERARLVRQRPGENVETPPLSTQHISRAQLVLRSHAEGGVAIENVGKRALAIGGHEVKEGRARTGDLVEIGNQMVLLCALRPLELPPLRARDARLVPAFGEADAFGYVGESPEAWRLRDEISLVARRKEHVLVLGESGAGKELAAQAIHALGPRGGRRLVARNAATVPSGIIDAELFGNAADYPNAGMAERPGLVGEADGSTLFLDEIGELPIELQTHLLRLLDGGDYQRLGDAKRRTADVRVIAATNRPIAQLKSDLAARFPLRVRAPGLHERREDVPLVARHLARRIASGGGGGEPRLSKELAVALTSHLYATHAREVGNILFRASVESRGDVLELTPGAREMLGLAPVEAASAPSRELTREVVLEALAKHDGVREKAWRELGLTNRYVLKRLMKKYGISGDEEP